MDGFCEDFSLDCLNDGLNDGLMDVLLMGLFEGEVLGFLGFTWANIGTVVNTRNKIAVNILRSIGHTYDKIWLKLL